MAEFPVELYIYDASKGMARSMSTAFLGKQIDGIWHTAVVVHGQEFFFGGGGIESCQPIEQFDPKLNATPKISSILLFRLGMYIVNSFPSTGGTILGPPDTIHCLGTTQIPFDMFMDYLQDVAQTRFRPECYHLFDHNCNTFSNEIANFLTGKNIPSHITDLPKEVLDTPMGAMLKPLVDSMMNINYGSGARPVFPQAHSSGATPNVLPTGGSSAVVSPPATQSKSSAPPETKSQCTASATSMTEKQIQNVTVPVISQEAIIFADIKVLGQFPGSRPSLGQSIQARDMSVLDEVHEYLSCQDCSWSLGKDHLQLLCKLLRSSSLSAEDWSLISGLLLLSVLKEDVMQLLQHDRDHSVPLLAVSLDQYPERLHITLAKVLCNCCSTRTGCDWSTSDKEWSRDSDVTSNQRLTYSVCTTCILSDNTEVRSAGTSLAYNLTLYKDKITEEESLELGSALIQALSSQATLPSDDVKHCLESLLVCMDTNAEVGGLAAVMGLDVSKYKDTWEQLCNQISGLMTCT